MFKKNIFIFAVFLISNSVIFASDSKKTQIMSLSPEKSRHCQTEYQRCTAREHPYKDVKQYQCYDAFRYCMVQGLFITPGLPGF